MRVVLLPLPFCNGNGLMTWTVDVVMIFFIYAVYGTYSKITVCMGV